jgi:hypothetical protein
LSSPAEQSHSAESSLPSKNPPLQLRLIDPIAAEDMATDEFAVPLVPPVLPPPVVRPPVLAATCCVLK